MKNIFAKLFCNHEYHDAFVSKQVKKGTSGYINLTKHICINCGKVKYIAEK